MKETVSFSSNGLGCGHTGGWQYTNPTAEDYEHICEYLFGKHRNFAVFYDGIPVCGRVHANPKPLGIIKRTYRHVKIWHFIRMKRRKARPRNTSIAILESLMFDNEGNRV